MFYYLYFYNVMEFISIQLIYGFARRRRYAPSPTSPRASGAGWIADSTIEAADERNKNDPLKTNGLRHARAGA